MIVSCPSCKTKYQFEESRFGDSTSKRLKCTKCETAFEISKPVLEEGQVSRTAVVPGKSGERAADKLEHKEWAVARDLIKKASDLGLSSVDIPEAYGGTDMDKVSSASSPTGGRSTRASPLPGADTPASARCPSSTSEPRSSTP
jgi:predicted Zn finger-like uncharacterized protein